jgi:predicted  nucleic acid-binding Zn-ribbon protein
MSHCKVCHFNVDYCICSLESIKNKFRDNLFKFEQLLEDRKTNFRELSKLRHELKKTVFNMTYEIKALRYRQDSCERYH